MSRVSSSTWLSVSKKAPGMAQRFCRIKRAWTIRGTGPWLYLVNCRLKAHTVSDQWSVLAWGEDCSLRGPVEDLLPTALNCPRLTLRVSKCVCVCICINLHHKLCFLSCPNYFKSVLKHERLWCCPETREFQKPSRFLNDHCLMSLFLCICSASVISYFYVNFPLKHLKLMQWRSLKIAFYSNNNCNYPQAVQWETKIGSNGKSASCLLHFAMTHVSIFVLFMTFLWKL